MSTLEQLFQNEEIQVEAAQSNTPAVVVQPKIDGMRLILHCSKDKVKIMSDTGIWIENQFPSLVEYILKQDWQASEWIWDAEVEAWAGNKHEPREAIAARVHEKEAVEPGTFVCTVFDVLYMDKDVHKLSQRERLKLLDQFPLKQSTLGVPDTKIPLNKIVSFFPKTETELRRDLNKCIRRVGSEGSMIKECDTERSGYSLSGSTMAMIKLKSYAEARFLVLKRNPTDVSPITFNYELAVRFTSQDKIPEKYIWELKGKKYHWTGRSYNTSIKAEPGDVLVISWHSLNLYTDPKTGEQRIHAYEPRVKERWREGALPDLFSSLVRIGRDSGLLVEKEVAKNLDLIYPIPESSQKNFSPTYRRGEEYDTGILEVEKVPEGISPGRFIWFASDGEEDAIDIVESAD